MSFVGFIISPDSRLNVLIKFACKSVTYKGEVMTDEELDRFEFTKFDNFPHLYRHSNEFTFELYDDIIVKKYNVMYKEDENIGICNMFNLCNLIYFFNFTTYTDEIEISNFTEESWMNLFIWKKTLQAQGRIPKDTKFSLVKNNE